MNSRRSIDLFIAAIAAFCAVFPLARAAGAQSPGDAPGGPTSLVPAVRHDGTNLGFGVGPLTLRPDYNGCGGVNAPVISASNEQLVVELTNLQREYYNHLPPFKREATLDNAARYHSTDLAQDNYFNHDSYDRSAGGGLVFVCAWNTRVQSYYGAYTNLAENIAAGYTSPAAVIAGWMNSTGHKANMLSTATWELGSGYYCCGGTYSRYWTQDFSKKSGRYPLVINREDGTTTSADVQLYLYGSWSEMRLKNDTGAFGPWRTFANHVLWTLNSGTGVRTVTAEMRTGGTTVTASDTIELVSGNPTATPTSLSTGTPIATATPLPSPTGSATASPSPSPSPTATQTLTPVVTPTNTALPPTATNTAVPPTATSTNTLVPPTATNTAVPPTATRTSTPVPPTATRTNTPVPPTATRTNTPVPPTATRTATSGPSPTRTATPTRTPRSGWGPFMVQVPPAADADVASEWPTSNNAAASGLQVRGLGSAQRRAFLRFDVNSLPGKVEGAKLRLFVQNDSVDGGSVYLAVGSWTEYGITWRNQAAPSGPALATLGSVSNGSYVTFDVSKAVTGAGSYTFAITNASADTVIYGSREARSSEQPRLIIRGR